MNKMKKVPLSSTHISQKVKWKACLLVGEQTYGGNHPHVPKHAATKYQTERMVISKVIKWYGRYIHVRNKMNNAAVCVCQTAENATTKPEKGGKMSLGWGLGEGQECAAQNARAGHIEYELSRHVLKQKEHPRYGVQQTYHHVTMVNVVTAEAIYRYTYRRLNVHRITNGGYGTTWWGMGQTLGRGQNKWRQVLHGRRGWGE